MNKQLFIHIPPLTRIISSVILMAGLNCSLYGMESEPKPDPKKDPKLREAAVKASAFDLLIHNANYLEQCELISTYKWALENEKARVPQDTTLDDEYKLCCERLRTYNSYLTAGFMVIRLLKPIFNTKTRVEVPTIIELVPNTRANQDRLILHVRQYLREQENNSALSLADQHPIIEPIPAAPPIPLKPRIARQERPKGFAGVVGGVDQAMLNLVGMLKDELDYRKFDLPFPRGILFAGPPGTGKTALARAVSEEVQCPFNDVVASSFIERIVGTGPLRIRALFAKAREDAKTAKAGKPGRAILFIDELDALGKRGDDNCAEYGNTITALLTEMDGFKQDDSVVVMGATNNPQALDPALLRPGRFGHTIEIPLPDIKKRIALLEFFGATRPTHISVDYELIAIQLEGRNVADIKGVGDLAAQLAMQTKSDCIAPAHFEEALQLFTTSEINKKKNHLR